MKDTLKSPFELRMDMITTAKDILDRQYEATRQIARANWEMAVETAKATQAAVMPAFPEIKYPSFDDIEALATKMNAFVSGK
jgi:hypothetical protein